MTAMSQGQAALLVIAFVMAISITVSVAVFLTALSYELRDRLARRRARQATASVTPLDSRARVGMSGRWSN